MVMPRPSAVSRTSNPGSAAPNRLAASERGWTVSRAAMLRITARAARAVCLTNRLQSG